MDDTGEKKSSEGFNQLDLTALSGFQFGTQWTGDKPSAEPKGGGEGRPGGDAREGRRDRRAFRRSGPGEGAPAGDRPPGDRPPREDRPFRPPGQGAPPRPQGGPPRDNRGFGGGERRGDRPPFRGGDRMERQDRFSDRRGPPRELPPYISPDFEVAFYPDETGFAALLGALRRTPVGFELFRIAHLLLEKNDRFVVVVKRRPGEGGRTGPVYLSLPDNLPFETEEAAVRHAVNANLTEFFEAEEVEIDPPKGSFPAVAKCPVTGTLLAPPNYHRYGQILAQHHSRHIGRQPFERWKSMLEMVRTPEAVQQWMDSMRKATRFTSKLEFDGQKPTFLSQEDATVFLTTRCREKLVREVPHARFPGRLIENVPGGEIRRAVEGALDAQRRFPLETANSLRGRLRRENFTLFKLPGHVPTYVSSARPRPRRHGQTFAAAIEALFQVLDAKPFLTYAELEAGYLQAVPATEEPTVMQPVEAPAEAPAPAPVAADVPETAEPVEQPQAAAAVEASGASSPVAEAPAPDAPVSAEGTASAEAASAAVETPATETAAPAASEQPSEPPTATPAEAPAAEPAPTVPPAVLEMRRNLAWLVHEGYVIELQDRRFYALPARAEEGKQGNKAQQSVVLEEGGGHAEPANAGEAPDETSG